MKQQSEPLATTDREHPGCAAVAKADPVPHESRSLERVTGPQLPLSRQLSAVVGALRQFGREERFRDDVRQLSHQSRARSGRWQRVNRPGKSGDSRV
jgi:hypothetical protein